VYSQTNQLVADHPVNYTKPTSPAFVSESLRFVSSVRSQEPMGEWQTILVPRAYDLFGQRNDILKNRGALGTTMVAVDRVQVKTSRLGFVVMTQRDNKV